MYRNIFDGVTLWIGMYTITCCLFWYETGSITTGLTMGLLSATLKTIWGLAHKRFVAKKDGGKTHCAGEGVV